MKSVNDLFELKCTGVYEQFVYFGFLGTSEDVNFWNMFGLDKKELNSEAECLFLTNSKYDIYQTLLESVAKKLRDLSVAICYYPEMEFILFLKGYSPTSTNIYTVLSDTASSYIDEYTRKFVFSLPLKGESCFVLAISENNQFNETEMYVFYPFNSIF